jgi:hypothetical protein
MKSRGSLHLLSQMTVVMAFFAGSVALDFFAGGDDECFHVMDAF